MPALLPNSRDARKARRWLVAVLLAILLGGLALWLVPRFSADPETIIFVIRHGEKSPAPSKDPPLAPAGEARAQELVHVLRSANIQKIYASEFQRTQQTVRPLAAALSLTVDTSFIGKDLTALAGDILQNHPGQTVLVAHHSNTVPQLIALLGGGVIPPIDEATEFDRLYIVHHRQSGVTVTRMKYGAAASL